MKYKIKLKNRNGFLLVTASNVTFSEGFVQFTMNMPGMEMIVAAFRTDEVEFLFFDNYVIMPRSEKIKSILR